MITLVKDLTRHKAYADAMLFGAIRSANVTCDQELLSTLHHMLLANRFWLSLILDRAFEFEQESAAPVEFEALTERYRSTQAQEAAWIEQLSEAQLAGTITTPHLEGSVFSVAQGWTQVCLHSQGHRAQCAKRLRALGGSPEKSDYILWLARNRPEPRW